MNNCLKKWYYRARKLTNKENCTLEIMKWREQQKEVARIARRWSWVEPCKDANEVLDMWRGKMGLLFNENEIPIKNDLGLVQMIKWLFHFMKTNDFELAGKGGLLMAIKYKINYFSLLVRWSLECSAVVIKSVDVKHLGDASSTEGYHCKRRQEDWKNENQNI